MKIKFLIIVNLILSTHLFAQNQIDSNYLTAYQYLESSLKREIAPNLKQSVFVVENAYFNNQLSFQEYSSHISLLKGLAISMIANRKLIYEEKDKEKVEKFASVFTILTDTTVIYNDSLALHHLPFGYDFDDFFGDKDWSKTFVTKLLATKTGNCHSLPYLYKILCDELGAEAHLALAPNHLYIKHHSKKTGWYNTELTSATFPIDAWLMVSGYISLEAIQNAVYMDTIGTYRAVALCVVDLGQGFAKKYPDNDGSFILQCCELALKHFPTCINAMLLKAETLFAQHKKLVKEKGKDDTETKAKFAEMNKTYQQIYQSGYRQMPKQMYANWLLDLKENKDKYINKKVAVFNK
ncbi:hypothetical protein [Thermoflexibacter ruber]|nr:hypothetical protein [Thermoflexibacter ruber]